MNVLNLYISVIRICFGFRYSNFVLMLNNFEFSTFSGASNPTKEFVRNFQQIIQNEPNFPCFSPKNEDLTKKQTQTNPIFGHYQGIEPNSKSIQTQLLKRIKMNANIYHTKLYNNLSRWQSKKTNPKQIQSCPEFTPKVRSRRIKSNLKRSVINNVYKRLFPVICPGFFKLKTILYRGCDINPSKFFWYLFLGCVIKYPT
jgi:hypothetical protein